ncbi:MAG: COX15/CtaA family protein [Bacteroidota bacterium]|nr:COX15/CtaA family protein [Bacteroidota bacterium]MDP4232682.1 COX15/CtaA family protein [Bacteroidota bacterium]MDP4243185.1 COX15/CtaA family protein [Bacteroidota bacterium]MDP4287642.1 COX15/CtaA family protein [Bacteroidota bacterium]
MNLYLSNRLLHFFAVVISALCFLLLFIGGLVTSHQAGLSVPDWPTSFGSSMFTFPIKDWIGGIFFEHTHRLFATFVGYLILVQALIWQFDFRGLWKRLLWSAAAVGAVYLIISFFDLATEALGTGLPGIAFAAAIPLAFCLVVLLYIVSALVSSKMDHVSRDSSTSVSRRLSWYALAGVVLQGILGGMTVLYYLPATISSAHAGLGQAVFCLTLAIGIVSGKRWNVIRPKRVDRARFGIRTLSLLTVIAVFIQLLIGAVMRHTASGLAIPTLPLAPNGSLIPDFTSFGVAINFTHRVWAVVVTLLMFASARAVFRFHAKEKSLAKAMMFGVFLLGIQIVLGAIVIWTSKAVTPTTLHVSCGAAILGTMFYIMLLSRHWYSAPVNQEAESIAERNAEFVPATQS